MITTRNLIHESTYLIKWEEKEYVLIDHDDEDNLYEQLREDYYSCIDAMPFNEWLCDNYTAETLYLALKDGGSLDDIWDEYNEYFEEEMYNFFNDSVYFAWL